MEQAFEIRFSGLAGWREDSPALVDLLRARGAELWRQEQTAPSDRVDLYVAQLGVRAGSLLTHTAGSTGRHWLVPNQDHLLAWAALARPLDVVTALDAVPAIGVYAHRGRTLPDGLVDRVEQVLDIRPGTIHRVFGEHLRQRDDAVSAAEAVDALASAPGLAGLRSGRSVVSGAAPSAVDTLITRPRGRDAGRPPTR